MKSKSSFFTVLIVILLALAGGFLLLQDSDDPIISLSPETDIVSLNMPLTVTVTDPSSNIKYISVVVRLGNRIIPILDQSFSDKASTQSVTFSLKNTGLKDGPIELEIHAKDDSLGNFARGNETELILPLHIDSVPPNVFVKTSRPNIRRGGSACIVYGISKEVTQTGVKVGELFFPAFKQPNGDFLCFFAFPYYMTTQEFNPQLVAVDRAGNTNIKSVDVHRMHRDFKHDTISIGQRFLDLKGAEFAQMVPGDMTELERFLEVNGRVRRENALALLEIGKDTGPEILWNGSFLRLPRSASRAGFADFRTYTWEGEKVDEQVHLGFDLASVARDNVPAANNGRVVFAGYLGIYGNLVIIDHGAGMQSLYSHLTDYSVETGQTVNLGDIIGHTGATGMAGGDHLHFGILISGLEVTPLEWLDSHWIRDNITTRLKDAGIAVPDIQ